MNVIIFDFDGTIADSLEIVVKISNQLAPVFGYPVTRPEDIEQLKNLSSREIVQRSGISPFKLLFLLLRLRAELRREMPNLNLIAGMDEVLRTLKNQGHCLGIVTSNSSTNVHAFLAAHGLTDIFNFVDSGLALFGKGRVIKRLIKQKKLESSIVIYVGDETRDIEAAHKIGIQVIAVSWGFNSTQALAAEQPDFLIDQPHELLNVVAHLQTTDRNEI